MLTCFLLAVAACREKYKRTGEGKDPDEACTVCMCEMEPDEECIDLPCGHSFHVECCTSWLHWNGTCPNCRQPIEISPRAGAGAGAGASVGAGAGAGAGASVGARAAKDAGSGD